MVDLINIAIDNKTPVKKLGLASFSEDLAYRSNSESAMLQIHSYCGELTNKRIKEIPLNDDQGFNNWIHNLNGVASKRLNHLNVTDSYFKGAFVYTNFSNSDMTNVRFVFSSILDGLFKNTILNDSKYFMASLHDCYFNLCDMHKISFFHSYLSKIYMTKTNISNSSFNATSIINSKFEDVNFINVIFAASNIDQNTINKFENVTFKDTIVTGTLLANEPEAITDAEGVVRLTKVFNPS